MKVLLIATQEIAEVDILNRRLPAVMTPFMGKPFIQHVVEYLAEQGISDFEVVLCQSSEKVQELLGNGTRWGVNITYHLVNDPSESYNPLKGMGSHRENILIANAAQLPLIKLNDIENILEKNDSVYFSKSVHEDDEQKSKKEWLGWAGLTSSSIHQHEESLEDFFVSSISGEENNTTISLYSNQFLSVQSCTDILVSQQKLFNEEFKGLQLLANEVEPGIWLSRNVEIHPDAKIISPVYIGENCRLVNGCEIGPNVVVGDNCVVDDASKLNNTLVMPGTYIGEGLEITESLIDRNLLINTKLGSEIMVSDEFLLGSLTEFKSSKLMKYFRRLINGGLNHAY